MVWAIGGGGEGGKGGLADSREDECEEGDVAEDVEDCGGDDDGRFGVAFCWYQRPCACIVSANRTKV